MTTKACAGETSLALARGLCRQRRLRAQHFPHSLFAEPLWDMLLDLFIADAERRRLTVKSICIASGAPMSTALRHLNWLVEQGYAIRLDHPHDGRSVRVQLSEAGQEAMARFLASLAPDAQPVAISASATGAPSPTA